MADQLTDQEIAEKTLQLTEQFNQYLFEHPELLDRLPDQAMLVFLDADDPTFNQASIEQAKKSPLAEQKQPVYIKMQRRVRIVQQEDWEAEIVPAV